MACGSPSAAQPLSCSAPQALSILLLLSLSMTQGLRVGTCLGDSSPPYVIYDRSPSSARVYSQNLTGFEVDVFDSVFFLLGARVALSGDMAVASLLPPERPAFIPTPKHEMEAALANGTLDMAFCAMHLDADGERDFDFAPIHLETGLQAVVRHDLDKQDLTSMIGNVFLSFTDVYAIASLLILLYFALVFSHFVWLIEREVNGPFHENYGPGMMDSIWFALVTAFTVGYGDKCVATMPGKLVTVVWMILGAYFCGIFTAALTSAFVTIKTSASNADIQIHEVSDLLKFADSRIGVPTNETAEAMAGLTSRSINFEIMGSDFGVAQGLENRTIDIGIMDARTIKYYSRVSADFKGKVIESGPLLKQVGLAIGVSRPNGDFHPLFQPLSDALLEYMRGSIREIYEANVQKWFGASSSLQTDSNAGETESALREGNQVAAGILAAIAVGWGVAVAVHYRGEIREERVRQKFLKALALGKVYTLHELRVGAGHLFEKSDRDKSGTLDADEILQLLSKLGKEITIEDVRKYIDMHSYGSTGGQVSPSETPNPDAIVPFKDVEASANGNSKGLLINKNQFVKIIEGIVTDEQDDEDSQDPNEIPQRRHVLAVAADVQSQVLELDKKVFKELSSLRDQTSKISEKLDSLVGCDDGLS